jgi:hypothetical protein
MQGFMVSPYALPREMYELNPFKDCYFELFFKKIFVFQHKHLTIFVSFFDIAYDVCLLLA